MELQYIKQTEKFIGLLSMDSIGLLDHNHIFFPVIEEYSKLVSEIHILVFLQEKIHIPKEQHIVQVYANVWVYHIAPPLIRSPLIESWRIKNLAHRHLVWKGKFRPDFILSFSTETAGIQASKLAKRFNKPFFIESQCGFLHLSRLSTQRQTQSLVVANAHRIFVPTEHIQSLLISEFKFSKQEIIVVPPAISLSGIVNQEGVFSFKDVYPNYSVFCASYNAHAESGAIKTLREAMRRVVSQYPKIACILYVPLAAYKKTKRIVASDQKVTNIFVEKEPASLVTYYRGAHMCVFASEHDEINLPVVEAIASHVPVITTSVGLAPSIFSGGVYEKYLVPPGDAFALSERILYLIANPTMRDEFRINGAIMLRDKFPETLDAHVRQVVDSILVLFKK